MLTFCCRERFRTLTFNLGQSDRGPIHSRIASGSLSAYSLPQLDNTSLANETTRAEIVAAAAESLAQTILIRSLAAPRAKLTHKGMVELDTDDLPPDTIALHAREDREQEAEVQREAERLARARPTRKTSMSIPPQSPVTPQSSSEQFTWGAPPPVPQHALGSPSLYSLLNSAALDHTISTGSEMTLDDLIHFDDDVIQVDGEQFSVPPSPSDTAEHPHILSLASAIHGSDTGSGVDMIPFELASGMSPAVLNFDLSTLWGGQNGQDHFSSGANVNQMPAPNVPEDGQGDMDVDGDGNDRAFDMFLEDEESQATVNQPARVDEPKPVSPPPAQMVEDKPCVWTGTVRCVRFRVLGVALSYSPISSACPSIQRFHKQHPFVPARSPAGPLLPPRVFGRRSCPALSFGSMVGYRPRSRRSSCYRCA